MKDHKPAGRPAQPPATKPCPECGATLNARATYCLSCDTPLVVQTHTLSVNTDSERDHQRHGSPLRGIAMVAGAVLVLGVITWGLALAVRGNPGSDAHRTANTAFRALIKAEGGHDGSCRKASSLINGDEPTVMQQCQDLMGSEPGAHVDSMTMGKVRFTGKDATIHVDATVVDDAGKRREVVRTLLVHGDGGVWKLDWDGKRI